MTHDSPESPVAPLDPIARLFEEAGERIELQGSRFVDLGAPESAWRVVEGRLDLFRVETRGGAPVGRREPLASFEAGEAVFGLPLPGGDAWTILATGTVGTRVLGAPLARVLALGEAAPASTDETSRTTEAGASVAVAIDGAVERLLGTLLRDLPPAKVTDFRPGDSVTLAAGEVARPSHAIAWTRVVSGACAWADLPEAGALRAGDVAPVSPDTWVRATEGSELASVSSAELLAASPGSGAEALRAFGSWFVGAFEAVRNTRTLEEAVRRERKERIDRARVAGAFDLLASVLVRKHARTGVPASVDDPLPAAARLVGEARGVRILAPRPVRRGVVARDPLRDIARVSGVSARKVALRGAWWTADQGAMVGAWLENKAPIALLPISARAYRYVDPATGKGGRVTAEVAARIDGFATAFYPSLPPVPLGAVDLVRFGSRGVGMDFLMILLLGALGGSLGVAVPVATGAIFDTVIPAADRAQLVQICLGLGVAAAATMVFQVAQGIATLRIETRMGNAIQAGLWARLLNLPAGFFKNYSAGDLAQRAMGIETIRDVLSSTLVTSILTCVFSVFNLALLYYYDPWLAFWCTLMTGFSLFCTLGLGLIYVMGQRRMVEVQGRVAGMVLQFVTGMAKLRVAAAEGRAFSRWAELYRDQRAAALSGQNVSIVMAVVNATIPVGCTMAVFYLVAGGTGAPRMDTGTYLAFNSAFTTLLGSVVAIGASVLSLFAIHPQYERLAPILRTAPEVDGSKADPGELRGAIEVANVSFRYGDGPLILDGVSLRVNPGEFVALVGSTGSGKSTLFRLLLGFEKPVAGTIYYDSQDLETLDAREVRRRLGVVLQNGSLMSCDIFTNIVGSANLTQEDAWEAARMAGCEEDIRAMPMGMHTVVSEGATTVSGGQRQRILVARALVSRPRILYFDEATSALDNRTQAIVSESLRGLHATRVVIAHRLSTIVDADRIFVLHHGKIVQEGTYEELVSRPGVFADLAARQIAT